MCSISQKLLPGFQRRTNTPIKGERLKSVITMNSNRAEPGEELYVCVPKLKENVCLVPESLFLRFIIETTSVRKTIPAEGGKKETIVTEKGVFRNNLGKNLVEGLVIKVGGVVVYDNTREGLLGLYEDLWKTQKERKAMLAEGVMGEDVRKAISGDTSASEDGKLLGEIYKKQKIKLGNILEDHGVQVPNSLSDNFQYIITLGSNATVMEKGEYSLRGIELEYETIFSETLAKETQKEYSSGKKMGYRHVTMFRKEEWKKDAILINEIINLPRKNMNAIVMLFTKTNAHGTEEFAYPNISEVHLTVEGIPNSVYGHGPEEVEPNDNEGDTIRDYIIRLAEKGEINLREKRISKLTLSGMKKIILTYKRKKRETLNVNVTNALISKFSDLMSMMNLCDSDMKVELLENELFVSDLSNVVSWITPYVPCIGLVFGSITVGKHVVRKRRKKETKQGDESQ